MTQAAPSRMDAESTFDVLSGLGSRLQTLSPRLAYASDAPAETAVPRSLGANAKAFKRRVFGGHSLRLKLALVVLSCALGLPAALFALYLPWHTAQWRQIIDEQHRAHVPSLASALEPLLDSDGDALTDRMADALFHEDLVSISVTDAQGRLLATRNRAQPAPSNLTLHKARFADGSQLLVGFSDERLEGQWQAALRLAIGLLALAGLGVLTGTAMAFHRYVRRPLDHMLGAIQAAEAAEVPPPIEPPSEDDLGQVVSAYNRMQRRLDTKNRRLESLYHRTPGLLFTLDARGRFASVSDYFCTAIGHTRARLDGHALDELVAVDARESFRHHVRRELGLGMSLAAAPLTLVHADGRLLHMLISSMPEREPSGKLIGNLCVMTDVTKQVQDQEVIARQANFDPITRLPNRNLLRDRIQLGLHDASRTQTKLGVIFLDLDRFKHINDSLGHAAGDELLHSVAQRLQAMLRPGDTAARFGGDEFVVMLARVNHPGEVEVFARRLLTALNSPYELDGQPVYVGASLGIAMHPDDGDDPESLLKHADAAMYLAKDGGRNQLRFYASGMNERTKRWMQVESQLRQALQHDGFELAYQPVIDLRDGRLSGLEALLRLKDTDAQTLGPAEFILVAEESGLIQRIGDWVLERAIGTLAAWPGGPEAAPILAVNVSPRQLRDVQLPNRIDALLKRHRVPAGKLMLELTESSLIDATGASQVRALSAVGCPLALDDFGIGYSSLAYLKQFPFSTLKIDRSFISGLPNDREDRNLVEAVLAIARSFALDVVAEGVESAEQAAFLHEAGCAKCQGYFFGRPEIGLPWEHPALQS